MKINTTSDKNGAFLSILNRLAGPFRIAMLFVLLASPALYAGEVPMQDGTITMQKENVRLRTVLNEIERNSRYIFVYNDQVDVNSHVSVNVRNATVNAVLDEALEGTGISYVIEGNHVILNKKGTSSSGTSSGKRKKVQGTVTDSDGLPVIGANILVVGSSRGTVTDMDGRFSLEVGTEDVLRVSYIGFEDRDIKVGKRQDFAIVLRADTELLDEVVVVGYGTQKKVNLTGAVSVVNAKDFANRPLTNSTQALQGVQGVYVNSAAGAQPGNDAATVRIRGMGTFSSAGNEPLVLIDGVSGSLTDVNPSDIASISVLKDAASAAIYGSRAANGVILVTTKKGEEGKFSVSYNNSFSWQKITYLPDACWDPILYMQGYDKALRNEGASPLYADVIEEYRGGMKVDPYTYPATNWFDLYFRDAFMHEHNIRISGGNDHVQSALSVDYLDQEGVLKFTDAQRLSVNFNSTVKYGQFKAGITLSANYRDYNEPYHGVSDYMQLAMRALPVMTPYLADGSYGRSWLTTPGQNTFANLLTNREGKNNYKQTRIVSSVFAEYTFPRNIKYNITLGVRKVDLTQKRFIPLVYTYNPKTLEPQVMNQAYASASNTASDDLNPSVSQTLTWSDTFDKKHNVSALLGMTYETFNSETFTANGRGGYLDNQLTEIGLSTTPTNPSSSSSQVRLLSYFGRVNYDYDNRYLFEANFRYDGSSRFAEGHRWGLFPSFSAGWRIDQENFMEKTRDWLSNLKLRVSWGQLGNQSIGLFQYTPIMSSGANYAFGNTVATGYAVNKAVDPTISWETTTITNVALDFGFFNNSLSGSVEFFKKRTSDILRDVNQPSQVGNLTGAMRNIGTVDNTGFEASLSYRNHIGGFNYNIYGNVAYVKNEVIDVGGDDIISGRRIIREGYPIDAYYLYICDGIFQSEDQVKHHAYQSDQTEAGDLIFRDVSGPDGVPDGQITEDDRVVVGSSVPDYTYSFGVNMEYKGVGLNLFFQGVHGITTYPTHNLVYPYANGAGVTYDWLEKAWTPENTGGGYPRLLRTNSGHDNYEKSSTFWLRDASYLRLKNIQLSYDFPKKWINRIGVSDLKVFVNAENVLTFSDFDIFDPERSLTSDYIWSYPSVKSITCGLNVTF